MTIILTQFFRTETLVTWSTWTVCTGYRILSKTQICGQINDIYWAIMSSDENRFL